MPNALTASRIYIAIDLKSFYASVECMERGLNPLTTNLAVADASRTEKTICLAVSPSLKAYGISGRSRLFEVQQRIREVNAARQRKIQRAFEGESYDDIFLRKSPCWAVSYITATPRMALYIEYSTRIYGVYLKYIAPEDIHVYSIDEVFLDVTNYLRIAGQTPHGLARIIIQDVLQTTGITATAGIGSNLYLAKIAMDIMAKKIPADKDGVRIAELNEISYRHQLWEHKPLTDFWRVGKGYAAKLERYGLKTMGDIARCSIRHEELLYSLFGVNAELLIDHAWGWEPCTIADIKAYKPAANSIGSGQVLHDPYPADKARLVVREMVDSLSLTLVEKQLVTDQMVLTVGYDRESLTQRGYTYGGEIVVDSYGRKCPKPAHGTTNLDRYTASSKLLTDAVLALFDDIVNKRLLVRKLNLTACRVIHETDVQEKKSPQQLNLLTDYAAQKQENEQEKA